MTSFAKQTEGPGPGETEAASASRGPGRWLLAVAAGILAAGWVLILQVSHWRFGAPVFFLAVGWLSVVLFAWALGRAAWAAAAEPQDGASGEGYWHPVGRREELLSEKRSLLKALKEIDFDYQMGKLSQTDADELTRLYRQRAIAVIKALEAGGGDERELSFAQRVEREIEARLAVPGSRRQAAAGRSQTDAGAGDQHPSRGEAKDS